MLLLLAILQAAAQSANGNISPFSLEIDPSANLYPSGAPGFVDWVRDSLPNTDPPSLIDSVATGIIPNVTGAPGGTGHWNGVRIVDGINGGDQDIFLTGGKENDLSTWNIGPGTVGSSKYDITQAYLANNQTTLYFGMERRGNNGTTAFDFEFNQLPPNPSTPLLPTRSIGDVLFTFEMMGSGGSGSAVPHYFIWNGNKYIEQIPAPSSLVSSINNVDTQAAPWGYVNSKGNWVLGTLPRFEFAEASVSLAEAFPNFSPCNNRAFVQIRTRSSATDNSDLKDATRIFEFLFGGPEAVPSFALNCLAQFAYDATQSTDSMGGHNVTYSWDFTPPADVTLSGAGITGPDADGTYHSTSASGVVDVGLPAGVDSATIAARLTVIEGTACTDSSDLISITVLRPVSAAITQKTMDGGALSVTLTGSAPSATALQWQRLNSSGTWVDIAGATGSVFTYSSFEADTTPTVQSFNINGEPFQGKLFQVQIRLHAIRVSGGLTCEAFSSPVTVKKVIAVDP
jgi:hypothetical protein